MPIHLTQTIHSLRVRVVFDTSANLSASNATCPGTHWNTSTWSTGNFLGNTWINSTGVIADCYVQSSLAIVAGAGILDETNDSSWSAANWWVGDHLFAGSGVNFEYSRTHYSNRTDWNQNETVAYDDNVSYGPGAATSIRASPVFYFNGTLLQSNVYYVEVSLTFTVASGVYGEYGALTDARLNALLSGDHFGIVFV